MEPSEITHVKILVGSKSVVQAIGFLFQCSQYPPGPILLLELLVLFFHIPSCNFAFIVRLRRLQVEKKRHFDNKNINFLCIVI